ncbi:transposase family protein [Streptomyces sp. NPDC093594]|uniref:helix-turn-helix domain-containing protein n=1 Tax=Streptomyces sp. NPDC093594 TaxID=3155305 RepID=UPI00344D1886
MGAGAKHRQAFVDRLLATLVHLRHGVTHDVLACWFGVDRSTITRAAAVSGRRRRTPRRERVDRVKNKLNAAGLSTGSIAAAFRGQS